MLENLTEFGLRISVTRQCVAGYIKRRKLTGAALVERDGTVLISVEEALKQLDQRLDGDQRIANGKAKLSRGQPDQRAPASPQGAAPEATDVVALSVFLHTKSLPSGAALTVLAFGGDPRQAYMTYRGTLGEARFNHKLAFGSEPPDDYDPLPWDFYREEFGVEVSPDDLAAWDAEWERQYDEPANA